MHASCNIVKKERLRGRPTMSHVIIGTNDLKTQRPDVLQDWDYDLNGTLSPESVSVCSKKRIWWKCKNGHSYQISAAQKTHGQGCPLCAGKYCVSGINDFATMCPDMLKEWDYTANVGLDPKTIYYKSSKVRVHWKCQFGHQWETRLCNRVEHHSGCPICAGNVVLAGFNDLLSGFPNIAAEWNYERNSPLLPSEVSRFSTKKVWWKCEKCNYEWTAQISNRTGNKSGCPNCRKYSHTSFPEQALFFYIQKHFPDAVNGYRYSSANKRSELDIYIPSKNIGIEYDGIAWHRNDRSALRDTKKYDSCKEKGIFLVRISEFESPKNKQACDLFLYRESNDLTELNTVIERVLRFLGVQEDEEISVLRDQNKILVSYANVHDEKSLAFCFPEVAKEWDYKKNKGITPEKVNSTTDKRFWWKCENGHSWQSSVSNRTSAHCGCPYCSGKRVLKGYNDLQTKYPDIAKWWDEKKNAPIHASDVMPGSMKKYWWVCEKGHSYQATPNVKTANKTGCPVCSNSIIISGINSFADTHPKHAIFWDYNRNGDASPDQVPAGTMKRSFWICEDGHTWEETVTSFARRKPECPYCSGLRLLKGCNDLETEHPELLKDWDYEKNSIQPSEVRSNSTKKVYWKCSTCGNEWKTQIRLRAVDGKSCPVCCYKEKTVVKRIESLISSGRSLAERFPQIAKEWDYENNEKTPDEITYGSSMMAAWICPEGHRYKAIVADRTGKKKVGCSFCRYKRMSNTMKKKKLEYETATGKEISE